MLVVSTFRIKLRRAVKPSDQRKRLNLEKLKDPDVRTEFSIKLQNRFQTLADMEEQLEETGVDMAGDQEHLYRNWDKHLAIRKQEKEKMDITQDVETYRRKEIY